MSGCSTAPYATCDGHPSALLREVRAVSMLCVTYVYERDVSRQPGSVAERDDMIQTVLLAFWMHEAPFLCVTPFLNPNRSIGRLGVIISAKFEYVLLGTRWSRQDDWLSNQNDGL